MRKPNPGAARRSAARLAAVQALYSMEITDVGATQALDEFAARCEQDEVDASDAAEAAMAEPDRQMVAFLVQGVAADQGALDELVGAHLSRDWTVDRLEAVLRAILRAGAFELKSRPQTPARVAITEYVDVAHAFYAGPEPGLVNAVMDRLARHLRAAEFDPAG